MRDCGFLIVYQLIFPSESLRNWQYEKYAKIKEKEEEKELEEFEQEMQMRMMLENQNQGYYQNP